MTSEQAACLIWGTPAKTLPTARDGQKVASPRAAGCYYISGTAQATLNAWGETNKTLITSWLVEQRRLGVLCPDITSTTLNNIKRRRSLSVHERADNLLRYLDAKSDILGNIVKLYALDNSNDQKTAFELMAWTESRQVSEVKTLAEYCSEEGWIQHRATERSGSSKNTIHELMLRPLGYARLAELDSMNSDSKQAFVAMWFDDTMKDAYDQGISPAIEDAGYRAVRIDQKDHNNKIDDEIIAEIRRSRFLVADFTQGDSGARGGVYYEAGFAHGLGIPVIFICRQNAICNVHFDTRQYNHILWEDQSDLRDKLVKRISATIGDGPDKSRN